MVKIIWSEQGQILGDIEVVADGWKITNPVFISPGPQGVSMLPLMMFTDNASEVFLPREEAKFGGELFEPLTELRNHYNSQFGSGIQLLSP